jgi:hypothetical protein
MEKEEFQRIEKYKSELLYYYNNEPGLSKDNKEELLIEIANINDFIYNVHMQFSDMMPSTIEVTETPLEGAPIKRLFKSVVKLIDFYEIDANYGDFFYKIKKSNDIQGYYNHTKSNYCKLSIKLN